MNELRFHHLGIAVRDAVAAVEIYGRLFGYRLLRGPIDDPLQRVRACFIGGGRPDDIMMELVAPLPGVERSPIDRILEKGNTGYHVCYEVDGIEEVVARFTAEGCARVSEPVEAIAFEGRRIAWMLTPTRHLIELLEAPAAPAGSGREVGQGGS
jgi:methylmalonyl-CoA/ethylmalonyl-CoA epimerase